MATRSPVRPRPVRYGAPQAIRPARRRRFRWLRRLFLFLVVLAVLFVAVRAYVLHVYAPGLRAEARTIPALVHHQLAPQGAVYLPLDQMGPYLPRAIVAIEDRRFFYHPGVDPIGIIRAAWVNYRARHLDQGGSTLEEQLVKRAIVHDDRSIHAKLRTAALAWAVDQDFSKRKILELYLNDAYYGQGAYGANAAAHIYFGTDAAHLTLAQAAYLAALPQAPSIYGAHPTDAAIIERQNTVLQDMAANGDITDAQAQAAKKEPLRFAFPNP